MKQLLLIGIGPGDPRQVTFEAVDALKRATVFFVLDKGARSDELVRMRRAILERYLPTGDYRVLQVDDPQRDALASDYIEAVQDWHQQRAALYARLIDEELGPDDVGAFLLWGEPSLYDSTLRIPGISSIQALAARHQIPLNRIGEPLTVLPGRQLGAVKQIDNVLVMLDGQCAFADIDDPQLHIYWGAYLGTADELLLAGPLLQMKAQIVAAREQARQRKGWIMDTYLLRREL